MKKTIYLLALLVPFIMSCDKDEDIVETDFTISEVGKLNLKVVDNEGLAIEGAELVCNGVEGVFSDANGEININLLENPYSYVVNYTSPEGIKYSNSGSFQIFRDKTESQEINIMENTYDVTLYVEDSNGDLVPNQEIVLIYHDNFYSALSGSEKIEKYNLGLMSKKTDLEGKIEYTNLPEDATLYFHGFYHYIQYGTNNYTHNYLSITEGFYREDKSCTLTLTDKY